MIGIGINENVYLGTPSINKDKQLEVVFKQLDADPEAAAALKAKLEDNPFADWDDTGYSVSDGSGLTLRVFPFDSKASQNRPDEVVDLTVMKQRIDKSRAPLFQILSMYYPDVAKNPLRLTTIFEGTNIDFKDKVGTEKKLKSEAVQAKIYSNIANAFVEGMKPFEDDQTLLFRLLLVRQSAKKAYANLRSSYIDDNPFIESMKIPKEASKLKFTAYEKREGLDKSDPVSQDTADKPAKQDIAAEDDPFAAQ